MRLLASDYDGTLKQNGIEPKDIAAIECFREKGNIFGIVTGRTIGMIKNELAYYRIPYDFIIGTNGGIAVNKKLEVISKNNMDYRKAVTFMNEIKEINHIKIGVSNGDIYVVVRDFNNHSLLGKSTFSLVGAETSLLSEVLETKTVNSFFIRGRDETYTKELLTNLLITYGNDFNFHYNGGTIDVSALGVSKVTGVMAVKGYFGCELEDVFVIGDGYNDISMIREFNGFSVSRAPDAVKENAVKVFESVSACISYILNES